MSGSKVGVQVVVDHFFETSCGIMDCTVDVLLDLLSHVRASD